MNDDEVKLRKKLRSYRTAKYGCVFLAVMSALALGLVLMTGQTDSTTLAPLYAATFAWPAMAYICHLKAKLIYKELEN